MQFVRGRLSCPLRPCSLSCWSRRYSDRKPSTTSVTEKDEGLSATATDGTPHKTPPTLAAAEGVVRVDAAGSTPPSLTQRRVYIYQAARNAMQSGRLHENAQTWRIDFENGQPRWENPLMGWTSSRDPVQGVVLRFRTREEAVRFAERQGWMWAVREPNVTGSRGQSYAENFLYSANKLKLIRTK